MRILTLLMAVMMVGNANAGSLVVMGNSYHNVYDKTKYVTNNTYGIGYESRYFGGLVYKNSVDETSVMVYTKYDHNRYLSNSVGVASGYDDTKIITLTSFEYDNVRISSSYPFGKLANSATDVFNVQYIVKF